MWATLFRWPRRRHGSTRRRLRRRKLSRRILLFQLLILTATSVIGFALFAFAQRSVLDTQYQQRALVIAEITAGEPAIVRALVAGTPPSSTGVVQVTAQRIASDSGATYVVVVDLHRIRHSSPNPEAIGKPVRRQILVRDGKPHVRINETVGGRTANGLAPVFGPGHRLVGEASVGIPEARADSDLWRELPAFGLFAAAALGVGAAASLLLAARLKRSTFGLELEEIAGLLQDREATLYGIREGVVGFTAEGRITVVNDEARRLLGLSGDLDGRLLSELELDPAVTAMLSPGRTVSDEVVGVGDRLLVVSSWPTGREGGPPGSVTTLRDSTELRLLSDKAEAARRRLKLLYDASGGVGTTLDLTRTAEELARVGVPNFADFTAVDLIESVLRGEEPEADGSRMHRMAVVGNRDEHPFIPVGEVFDLDPTTPQAWAFGHEQPVLERDLRATDAWRAQYPARAREILAAGFHSRIAVPLRARGVLLGLVYFWRSERREPFDEDDLTLADQLAARGALCIDNARRFTREHMTAATLQRNLLPRGMPPQSALELAYRYLPALSVGGDWFDVIPLPGTRVALTVGDVVGHGLHAAVTMGRLRTAVRNFSALDLPPDELLWQVDELVARIDQEEAVTDGGGPVIGATCLYVIYDPTTRICTMARAGHPPPAVVLPDGRVEFLDVPSGPPLGLTGLPFESAEFEVPEGSRLVLYTDGLLKDRGRDLDEGMELLRAALTDGDRSAEDTCAALMESLMPARPGDDIALVVARTRAVAADRIAVWEVPADPAAVAQTRDRIGRQLARWDLDELVFSTELILSELVTNAIRYATGPIRVRLLRDRTLICEVSDGSSTSPHMTYAAATDEGGRGLFLVAQLAERWGTRYLATGKIIWAEQAIGRPPADSGG